MSKVRISITLEASLLDEVDRKAATLDESRSAVIERLLRTATLAEARTQLDVAAEAYYRSLTPAQRREDESYARASSRAARKVRID